MNTLFKSAAKFLFATSLLASFGLGHAATATATLNVTATVTANCSISTTPVAFGAYQPVGGGNVLATGTVVVACTKGATGLTVGLSNGGNYASSTRNLAGTGTNTDKLAYSLVQPTSATPGAACPAFGAGTAWIGATTLALSSPSGKAERTYNVCGQLAAGQDVSVDSYSDTVTATINF